MVDITPFGLIQPSRANTRETQTLEHFQRDYIRPGFCVNDENMVTWIQLGKPLNGFRVDLFTMFVERFIEPRGEFDPRVWLTRKVTKETFPCPSHFVFNPQGFVHTPVFVVLFPP